MFLAVRDIDLLASEESELHIRKPDEEDEEEEEEGEVVYDSQYEDDGSGSESSMDLMNEIPDIPPSDIDSDIDSDEENEQSISAMLNPGRCRSILILNKTKSGPMIVNLKI